MGASEAAGGNIMMDAFGVVALVAMTPLFTVQAVGLIYKRKMAETASVEEGAIESITHQIEEHQIAARWGAAEYSDEAGRFDADADMDYAASPEWVEEVKSDEALRRINEDNQYIDFDDYEFERFQSFVTMEDFDVRGFGGKIADAKDFGVKNVDAKNVDAKDFDAEDFDGKDADAKDVDAKDDTKDFDMTRSAESEKNS
jgi:hypothetical protein